MNESEMLKHIKALTKVIEKQAEYAEQLNRNFYHVQRQISTFAFRLAEIEGMKNED